MQQLRIHIQRQPICTCNDFKTVLHQQRVEIYQAAHIYIYRCCTWIGLTFAEQTWFTLTSDKAHQCTFSSHSILWNFLSICLRVYCKKLKSLRKASYKISVDVYCSCVCSILNNELDTVQTLCLLCVCVFTTIQTEWVWRLFREVGYAHIYTGQVYVCINMHV